MEKIFENIIKDNNIKQVLISESLKDDIPYLNKNLYYKSIDHSTLFIGIYRDEDIDRIYNHLGDKYILWFGNDCNPEYKNRLENVKKMAKLDIKKHFCITNRVNEYLNNSNIIPYEFYQKNTKSMSICIFVTQLPYNGGASTLAYDIYKYLDKNNLNVKICFFIKKKLFQSITKTNEKDTILLDSNVYVLPNRDKLIRRYTNITNQLCDFDLVIAVNYGVIPLIKPFYKNENIIYLVVGSPELTLGKNSPISKSISYNNFIENEYNINNLDDNTNVKMNIESMERCSIILANSLHTKKIYNKIYENYSSKIIYIGSIECEIYKNKYYFDDIIDYDTDNYKNREYDLICVSNNWNRLVKNIDLVYNIYKNLPKLNKIIIGSENKNYNFSKLPNTLVLGKVKNEVIHGIMSNSKILLVPSFFESASIVILEALSNKCKVLTSKNVSMSCIFEDKYLCKDIYSIVDWITKIHFLNKKNKIQYYIPENNNFLNFINKINNNPNNILSSVIS